MNQPPVILCPDLNKSTNFQNFFQNWQQTFPSFPFNDTKFVPKMHNNDTEMRQAEQNPNSAHYYKNIGNEYFKNGDCEKAIENYSIAIKMNDTESVFFSNRARCYKVLGNFKMAYQDAVQSVELDENNIKGHILIGQSLAELGKEEEGNDKLHLAIKKLTKVLALCSSPRFQAFEKDIKKNISRVKKVLSLKEIEITRVNQIETYKYLMELSTNDIKSYDMVIESKLDEINQFVSDPTKQLSLDIPDHLCCKITYELMEDPVVTVSGVSYERYALLEHFKRNGQFDPVTRVPVDSELIFPNVIIKEDIESFIESNPWAFEYKPGETYKDVKF